MAPDMDEKVAHLDKRISKVEWWIDDHERKTKDMGENIQRLLADVTSIKNSQRAVFWMAVGVILTVVAHSLGWLDALKLALGLAI